MVTADSAEPRRARWGRRVDTWHLWLAAIVAVGLAVRLGYVIGWSIPERENGDAIYYHLGANLLADGKGLPHPIALAFQFKEIPGADHPPAYIVYLAAGSLLGLRTFFEHQLWSCFLGAATVGMIGFAGREIGGKRCGLAAAGLAAVFPAIWVPDGLVLSETMAVFATTTVILAAYRCWNDPRPVAAAWLGVAVGVAALSRPELVVLGPLVALPLFWFRRATARRPVVSLLIAGAAALVVMAPWVLYNLSRFEEPVLLSNQLDRTMAASWCSEGFYGPRMGYKSYDCLSAAAVGDTREEQDANASDAWQSYAKDHLGRVPVVAAARVGRLWGFFRPVQQVGFETSFRGAAEKPPTWVAFGMTWAMLALAPIGAWRLRRRGTPIFPLLAPIVTVTASAALTFGQLRYRAPADPALVLLTAGLVANRSSANYDPPPAGSGDDSDRVEGPGDLVGSTALEGPADGSAGEWPRRKTRSRVPHHVTSDTASPMMCHDILDTPRTRSLNVIGTSTMSAPRRWARYASSTWKP
jgi:Dolichyl-phosphate-mannose-protein mannosyltransferase